MLTKLQTYLCQTEWARQKWFDNTVYVPDLGAHGLEILTYKYLCNSTLCYFFVWFMFYLLLLWSTLIEPS